MMLCSEGHAQTIESCDLEKPSYALKKVKSSDALAIYTHPCLTFNGAGAYIWASEVLLRFRIARGNLSKINHTVVRERKVTVIRQSSPSDILALNTHTILF